MVNSSTQLTANLKDTAFHGRRTRDNTTAGYNGASDAVHRYWNESCSGGLKICALGFHDVNRAITRVGVYVGAVASRK
jgi:hypothetical protein